MPNGMELLPWHAPASRLVPCSNLVVLSHSHRMETIATDFGILQSRQQISPLADSVLANGHLNL